MNSPPKVIASKKCQTTRKEECELGGKIVKTEENDPLQAQSLLSSLDLELHEQGSSVVLIFAKTSRACTTLVWTQMRPPS